MNPEEIETVVEDPADPIEEPQPAREPVQPVQERQQVQFQPPQQPQQPAYVPPARITRAKERAAALDDTLGAGGALKSIIEDIAGEAEDIGRENVTLRDQVQNQGQSISGIGFWNEHDQDPANKDYPSHVARGDYQKDLVAARANYVGDPNGEAMAKAEARGRYFSRIEGKRAGASANTTDEPKPAPVTRQVGATRVIPRGARQAPVTPPKRLTVSEQLEMGQIPKGFTEEQILSELSPR